MKRNKTPSFILELPLVVHPKQEKELLSRLESARNLYNSTLGESVNRCNLVRQSKIFQKARKIDKENNKKLRNELFSQAKEFHNFNEFSLHKFIGELRHNIVNNLDIQTTQKLATRAFHATENILYGKAKKVRFKGYNQFNSVESKSNVVGIRWRNNQVMWNKLELKPLIKIDDEVIQHGLKHKVKYCRLFRKIIKGQNRFYVQLILEGKSFIKEKNKMGKGNVAFDFGPSTLAVVSQDENNIFSAKLLQFCSELITKEQQIRNLQQKIDRERRQNNPQNYLPNGKNKKGRMKWKKSKRQMKNQKLLREINRRTSEHRKSLQGKLSNEVLRMGNNFKTEKVSRKWLQKNFGKSVGIRAPGMFVSGMKLKAERAGGSFLEFPTQTTKLSQTCVCGIQKKKKLSERVHVCGCGVQAQRDLLSAFLGLFVKEIKAESESKYILQANQAKKYWSSADKLLQTAWRISLQSVNGRKIPSSFGNLKNFQSQNRSFAEEGSKRVKFEVQDDVLAKSVGEESLKENEMFPLEPTGF